MVPRTIDDQVAWIDEHSGGHPAVVATDTAGEVIGFGSLSPFRDRPAYAPTVEDSVYVHRDHRGKGLGRALLEELVRRGGPRLPLDDGPHRRRARRLDRAAPSVRVRLVGAEREVGRKFNPWLDVVVLQLLL